MKFIDIKTGNLYKGVSPYVHWFPDQQSTNLIYTHEICFITSSQTIFISMDSNVFNIINDEKLSSTIPYKEMIWDWNRGEYLSEGLPLNGEFIHLLHVTAQSELAGEYTTDIQIRDYQDNTWNITVGADFYAEHEPTYINLSNKGVDLPHAIQNAIYDVNVNESMTDNIVMNRKLKELLSNYWDVVANKGNYKSLINSLNWFEWGDLLNLQEVWEHNEFGNKILDTKDLCSLLESKYNDTYNGFRKTSYLSLYAATQKLSIKNEWDDEGNPELDEIVFKWSKDDLMLKLCLLGNFYETYFMPIHLELLHATVENVVFTNTIKIIDSSACTRTDYIYNIGAAGCNIESGQSFVLGNVKCQVGPDTMFGVKWNGENKYNLVNPIGVDRIAEFKDVSDDTPISDPELKSFYSQLYEGIGVLVDVECDVTLNNEDFIIESKLWLNDHMAVDNRIIRDSKIKFTVLLPKEGKYHLNMQFKTASSHIYCKHIIINAVDVENMSLKVYKVKHHPFTNKIYGDNTINNYKFSRCRMKSGYAPIVQYIIPTTDSESGIALNNVLVLKGDYMNNFSINNHYYAYKKDTGSDVYTICVSRNYWFKPDNQPFYQEIKPYIYRNDYGYFPEFHYLIELDGNKESDYYIYNGDTVAVIPELPLGLEIDDFDWTFTNASNNKTYKFKYIQEPFVASDEFNTELTPGYYDVIFKFKVGEEWHQLKMDSIFRKI